jgi:hypothetical protein
MLHPFSEDICKINVILEMCTTYMGVPYGPALINYKARNAEYFSFKGIGFFNKGKLHMSPFTCISGNGTKL